MVSRVVGEYECGYTRPVTAGPFIAERFDSFLVDDLRTNS